MTNWTQEREAAALRAIEIRAALITLPQIEQDLFDVIHESQRLREELIEAWTHREYRCPCSEKQRDPDQQSWPWINCNCGLNEALYAPEGE